MGKKPDSEKPETTWDGTQPGPGKVDHDGNKTQKFDLYTWNRDSEPEQLFSSRKGKDDPTYR